MYNNKLDLIYFSPTGTTKKVLEAIADGMNFPKTEKINITLKDSIKEQEFTEDDFVIIGVPVYSSRIPLTAANRLQNFRANNTKVVLAVVYGNRHYGDALLELKDLAVELGFSPIAAATFIGEHSFNSFKYPIAKGRPNVKDLKFAKNFGKKIMADFENHKEIKIPGTYPYKERSEKLKVKPKIDINLCDLCGMCEKVCPVDAISIFEDRMDIDENLCIYCHACVRICPQKAMSIDDERIIGFTKSLHEKCKEPQIPEIFL